MSTTGSAANHRSPILTGEPADRARTIAAEVAKRLLNADTVARTYEETTRSLARADAPTRRWSGPGLSGAAAAGALLCAELDRAEPGIGWDRRGHQLLGIAASAAEATDVPLGLFDGVAGLGYAADRLAAGRERYGNLLESIDGVLIEAAGVRAARLRTTLGLPVRDWDLVSGLVGIGVYLLARRDVPPARAALEQVLGALVALSCDGMGIARWATPAEHLFGYLRDHAPGGCVNCGLAHGVPGPLALLSLALRDGVEVSGQADAIRRLANWLGAQARPGAAGPDWPAAVPADASAEASAAGGGLPLARPGWCYGNAGVARALWLAGSAVDDPGLTTLARGAIRRALARQAADRPLTGATFCHGIAGLAHVGMRIGADDGADDVGAGAQDLCVELISRFEAGSAFGYRDLAAGGDDQMVEVDDPTLLSGASGIALVLLTAASERDPDWDRAVLLS